MYFYAGMPLIGYEALVILSQVYMCVPAEIQACGALEGEIETAWFMQPYRAWLITSGSGHPFSKSLLTESALSDGE